MAKKLQKIVLFANLAVEFAVAVNTDVLGFTELISVPEIVLPVILKPEGRLFAVYVIAVFARFVADKAKLTAEFAK